jgi:TonB family protein
MRQSKSSPLRLPRQRSSRKTIAVAVLTSLAFHLPLVLLLPLLFDNNESLDPTEFDAQREFSLSVIDESETDDDDPDRDGQFVSFEKPEREQRPEEARFLDQFDSTADEESYRKESRDDQQEPSETPPVPEPAPPSERPEAPDEPSEADESSEESEPSDAPDGAEEAVELDEEARVDEGVVAEDGRSFEDVDTKQLFPSTANLPASFAGNGMDYLRDVEEGEKTLLNRKRSRYWSFMDRLKRQVSKEWSPGGEYQRRDPRGNVYGVKDRFTALRITLNGDGSLRSLRVVNPSGLDFLDEEAMSAVRDAAPFPNPPEGLKDEDGLIHLTFGFLLDVRSGKMRNIRIERD